MKKLYTMLLAAAVAFSAAAVTTPFKAEKATKAMELNTKIETRDTKANCKIDVNKLRSMEDRLLKVPNSRAEEYPSFDREYFLMSMEDSVAPYYDLSLCRLYDDPEAPNAGLFILENFIIQGANNVDCDFSFLQLTDTYSLPVLTIKGAGKVPLFTSSGKTYYLWFIAYDEGKVYKYTDMDIEFILLNDGSLMYMYDNTCGLAFLSTDGYGAFFFDPGMVIPNGTFTSDVADGIEEDEDGEGSHLTGGTVECKVYAEYYEEMGMLFLGNFGDYGITSVYAIDTENKEIISPDQMIVELYLQSGASFPAYLLGDLDGNFARGTFTCADGKTTFTIPEAWVVVPADEDLGIKQTTWYNILFDTEITLDFAIMSDDTNGIANVGVDTNAPVEYYNLQGVRVANPEAGLYIKRQGNTATKVFVK